MIPNYRRIAPLGTADVIAKWEGRSTKKPWHYRVTACLPHLGTPDLLELVILMLRQQTERPYIVVVDTGSDPATVQQLERLRADDVELHYVWGHGYIHSSAPITTALDLGFALCRSELLYNTHTDVFPMRRDFLADLASQCNVSLPVVGYEMSERSWVTDDWRGIPGHIATMYHMPTMRREGILWSMELAYELTSWGGKTAHGWPDTETGAGFLFKQKGIPVKLIGQIPNTPFEDANLAHLHNYPSKKLYHHAGIDVPRMERMISEAKQRLAAWERGS